MSDLYRISFRIERDEIVPEFIFKRMISRPCRDLDLHGRLRRLSDDMYDAIIEGPRPKVERYFDYLRVGECITGILSVVNRMYITFYGLKPGFIYVDFDKKQRKTMPDESTKRERPEPGHGQEKEGKRQKMSDGPS